MAENQTERRYQGESGTRYHSAKRSIPEEAYPWVARLRAQKFAKYVGARDAVLEYGAGYGWNLAQLACGSKIGLEITESMADTLASRGIKFITQVKQVASESMDVVICHHTLEHLLQPAEILGELHRVLRTAGKLLLFVPYERERRYRHYDRLEPNHHLYSWTPQTLGHLVEDCGFEVTEAGLLRFRFDRLAAVWASRLGVGEPGFRLLRRFLLLLAPGYEVKVIAQKRKTELA